VPKAPPVAGLFSVWVLDVSIKPVLHSASLHFLCSALQAVADGFLREYLRNTLAIQSPFSGAASQAE
jgi:hypothetical protein